MANMSDRVTECDLADFEFSTSGRGRGLKKWDWDTMFQTYNTETGKVGKVVLDQEGDSKPSSFNVNVRNAAQDRGLSVQVSIKGKTVYFRAHKGSEEEVAELKQKAKERHAEWVVAAKRRASEKAGTNGTSTKKDLADEFEDESQEDSGVDNSAETQEETQDEETEPQVDEKPKESKKAKKRREAAEKAATL